MFNFSKCWNFTSIWQTDNISHCHRQLHTVDISIFTQSPWMKPSIKFLNPLLKANFRIKGWKQRWFVLDSTKHQLRYYDTREDFQCRGHIDLSEVTRVVESASAPGAPKKSEDRCFFELQTVKRNYVLCADSRSAAQDWISKIQMCLQWRNFENWRNHLKTSRKFKFWREYFKNGWKSKKNCQKLKLHYMLRCLRLQRREIIGAVKI